MRLVAGAEKASAATPIPTQIVSNGEYLPPTQSEVQKRVERRIFELADENGKKLGLSRRQFMATGCGMAAAFLAMKEIYGTNAPEKLLYSLFERKTAELKEKIDGDTIERRAKTLAAVRDEQGYMAQYLDGTNEGGPQILECHSPIMNLVERYAIIGGGANLVASDQGYPGVVVRYTSAALEFAGDMVTVAAGAVLQDLVDASIARGLRGLETMTGIPGWVGGAVYGNAGAYGHSIQERVVGVRYLERGSVCEISNAAGESAARFK